MIFYNKFHMHDICVKFFSIEFIKDIHKNSSSFQYFSKCDLINFPLDEILKTRMHSSRMRTGRSLTVCWRMRGRVFYSYFRMSTEHRSLLVVYVFNFYQTLRVVPHGTKGTGPGFVTRPEYLRSHSGTTQTQFLL